MIRSLLLLCCLWPLSACCQLDAERKALQPLPDMGKTYSFTEILGRARTQATVALEAFYVDSWTQLEEAAQSLEQTARFLPKTSEIPAKHKGGLVTEAADLGKDAHKLRVAAQAKDVANANEALQRIHLKIRMLRPDPPPAPKDKEKESTE